jgi:hypothetical protein
VRHKADGLLPHRLILDTYSAIASGKADFSAFLIAVFGVLRKVKKRVDIAGMVNSIE